MQIRTAGIGLVVGGLIAAGGSFAVHLQESAEKFFETSLGKVGLVAGVALLLAGIALVAQVNPPRLVAFAGLLLGLVAVGAGVLGYLDARDVEGDTAGGGPLIVALGGLMAVAIGVLALRPPPD